MAERPVLVTAFDPFGGADRNSSQALLELLPGRVTVRGLEPPAGVVAPGGADSSATTIPLERLTLPTEFERGSQVLVDAIDRLGPRAVISLGQAAGRRALTPERVAINVDDARIPDNAGAQPINVPINADGPAAYFSTLPLGALIAAMRAVGAPVQLSNTAGTFVCNHIMYVALDHLATRGRTDIPTGFIHVPALADLDLPQAANALEVGIVALFTGDDAVLPSDSGALH